MALVASQRHAPRGRIKAPEDAADDRRLPPSRPWGEAARASIPEPIVASHPMAACLDLRAMFAGVFRFTDDPSLEAELSDRRGIERAWLTRIPCAAGGFIAPAGGRELIAFTRTRRRALRALRGVRVCQDSGDEVIARFDVADLETVATALGAKRRRRLSDAQRAQLTKIGAQTRFSRPGRTIAPDPCPQAA